MLVDEKPWPVVVGEAVPGLKHGADRVIMNERLDNGICNLKVERFGEAVEVSRYKSQVACDDVLIAHGETENEGVFVMHMFWRVNGADGTKVSEVPDVSEVSDG